MQTPPQTTSRATPRADTQATLIYNASSGGANSASAEDLQEALQNAGFQPVYKATSREEDLDDALKDAAGLVVVAGGDGTVRAVATRLIGKDLPLTLLPLGTANNVARTLGLEGSPIALIEGLASAEQRPFDVGHVRSPWGEDYFLEALGCGLFADLLYDYDPEEGKSVLRAVDTVREVLVGYEPKAWQVTLDGEELSGEFVALEVLNTQATGPRLRLAPDADPSDGLFDVVCVREPKSAGLLNYLGGLLSDTFDSLENVDILKGTHLKIAWNGSPIHIDAELRPKKEPDAPGTQPALGARPPSQSGTDALVEVRMMANALTFWLPQKG